MRQLFETWEDTLGRVARSTGGEQPLVGRAAFTAAYKETFQPEEGLADLLAIGALPPGKAMRARVWGPEFETDISGDERKRLGDEWFETLRPHLSKSGAAAALRTATELRCDNETVALLSLEIGRIEKLWLGEALG